MLAFSIASSRLKSKRALGVLPHAVCLARQSWTIAFRCSLHCRTVSGALGLSLHVRTSSDWWLLVNRLKLISSATFFSKIMEKPHEIFGMGLGFHWFICSNTPFAVSQNLCSHSPLVHGSKARAACFHFATLCPKATSRSGRWVYGMERSTDVTCVSTYMQSSSSDSALIACMRMLLYIYSPTFGRRGQRG
jgi:hypothetical protein